MKDEAVDVFKVNPNALSFEDVFWHFACMSMYYRQNNDFYMTKKCLTAVCDLNYYYTALIYFHAFAILPKKFEKYIKKFEHPMKNDKLEGMIHDANKRDKKDIRKSFWLYSSFSLLLIPLMIILIVVLHVPEKTAVIIGVLFMFSMQIFGGPLHKKRLARKERKREILLNANERRYFNYLLPIRALINDKKYQAMIYSESDAERKTIIDAIKNNKPLPKEILNKKKSGKERKKTK